MRVDAKILDENCTSEVIGAKGEVEEQVGLAPDQRENERYDPRGQEGGIEEEPGKHETLGHHLGERGFVSVVSRRWSSGVYKTRPARVRNRNKGRSTPNGLACSKRNGKVMDKR